MRKTVICVLLLAIPGAFPVAAGAREKGGEAALWAGTAGAFFPLEAGTPVALVGEEMSFTCVPPPRRALADPRIAESWEVSVVATLRNTRDKPVTVTLALPEIPTSGPQGAPAIRELAFFVDGARMTETRVDEPGPRVPGSPAFRIFRTFKVPFEPSQARRVDALFRMAAPLVDGLTHLRFVWGAQARFGGKTVGSVEMSFLFGDRVRLVPENGRQWELAAGNAPGVKTIFYDDGRNSRLGMMIKDAAPTPTLAFAVSPEGPVLAGTSPRSVAQGMRRAKELSPPEFGMALAVYQAAYGRPFRDKTTRAVFEERPWGPCNPAFAVAHGQGLGAASVEAFLEAHPCAVNCAKERMRPRDPYGERWQDPVCWYSPVPGLTRTMITDPDARAQADAIEARLARMEAKSTKAKHRTASAEARPAAAPKGGCGCAFVGNDPAGGLAPRSRSGGRRVCARAPQGAEAVTYNFDPEKWFDLQESTLRAKLVRGDLDERRFNEALDKLVDEYEELLKRVDIRCDY